MNKRKICVVTGTRAEYGLLYWIMKEIQADKALELQLIATGMHLSPEFGLTYKEIEKDFNINKKIEADGMMTSLNNVVLGVLTADCAPIFIYDNKKKFVCCLHSGWKGTLKNISKNAENCIELSVVACLCNMKYQALSYFV